VSKDSSKEGSMPSWVGAYPFPPNKKKAVRISRDEAILFSYGRGGDVVSCTTHISTDCIQVGVMIIPPGGTFSPPDIHSGHEIYYIKTGEICVLNPETGLGARASAGDFLWIPKGVWHQAFNVDSDRLEVVAFIAPLQWSEGDAQVPETYSGPSGYFCGSAKDNSAIGNWPQKGGGCIESIRTVTRSQALHMIAGPTRHYPIALYVSDDLINVGAFDLAPGMVSDAQKHAGDKVIYVLEGCLGINTYEDGHETGQTVQDIHEVYPDQAFLVPGGLKHRYANLGGNKVRVVFGVAPTF
jgi:mannose-6-phosphate isomerase-like protein (cupin superfamily)